MSGTPERPALSRSASAAADAAVHSAPQELASVANTPGSSSFWSGWHALSASAEHSARPTPLPAGTLPEVRLRDFTRYLQSVGDKLEGFERDKATAEQWAEQSVNPESMRASQGQGLAQAMDEVPALYFQDDFDLDRAELWQLLGDVHLEPVRQAALEQLSRYLDAIEGYLVREIAARYDSFFDASGYVQDLGASVHRLYQQVAEMRARVAALEREAGRGVRVADSLQRQQANMRATLDTLKAMEGVAQAQSALQNIMADAGGVAVDFAAAIDILEVLQGALDNKELLSLRCFRGLPSQVAGSMQAIEDLMTADFLERTRFAAREACLGAITDRLRAQLARSNSSEGVAARSHAAPRGGDHAPAAGVLQAADIALTDVAALHQAASLLRAEWVTHDSVEEVLLPLAVGLQRVGHLAPAMKTLQEASCQQMRDFVADTMEGCLAVFGYSQDSVHLLAARSPSKPTDRIPKLTSEQFIWLGEAVLLAVQGFLLHGSRIDASLATVLGQVPRQSAARDAHHPAASSGSHAVAEVAASRWSKLLAARAHALPGGTRLAELRSVLDMTDALASLVEAHGVRSVLGLRTALQQLCKVTLESLHQQSISKLTTLLEQEQWSALEVAPQCQRIVDALERRQHPGAASSNGGAPSGGAPAPALLVAGQRYHIVQTEQLLLGMLGEYLAFRDAVPAFSADVAQRVLELLKIFNSKACQLVLGAGAMQVSGLKSITAKHLAVCCQCVGALSALHPALVAAFVHGAPAPRADMLASGFQRMLQDFDIHCEEIRSKLVGMMHERLAANVKQLPVLAASWPGGAAAGAPAAPAPSSFAATTVKQLQILAGVLTPLLLPAEVRGIMGSIGAMFSSALAEAYDDLQPRGPAWEAQMLADLECFLSCLRELPMEPGVREANLTMLAGMYAHRLKHATAEKERAAAAAAVASPPRQPQGRSTPPPSPRPRSEPALAPAALPPPPQEEALPVLQPSPPTGAKEDAPPAPAAPLPQPLVEALPARKQPPAHPLMEAEPAAAPLVHPLAQPVPAPAPATSAHLEPVDVQSAAAMEVQPPLPPAPAEVRPVLPAADANKAPTLPANEQETDAEELDEQFADVDLLADD